MSKTMRRLAILFAAVCVLMIMAVPAFADAGDGYYLISNRTIPSYSSPINVRLVIQGRNYVEGNSSAMSENFKITLSGDTSYTVHDVLDTLNNDTTKTVKACDINGNSIPSTSDYVYQFKSGTKYCGPIFYSDHGDGDVLCDGWVFRINGQYPLLSTTGENGGPKGASINQTQVADGDVIYFYFNHPWYENNVDWSTGFVAASTQYASGVLTVQLQYSNDRHSDKPYVWSIDSYNNHNFTNFSVSTPTTTGYLYDSNFDYVTSLSFDTSTGYAQKTVSLSSGIYYLKVGATKNWISRTWFLDPNEITTGTYNFLDTTMVYDRIVIN